VTDSPQGHAPASQLPTTSSPDLAYRSRTPEATSELDKADRPMHQAASQTCPTPTRARLLRDIARPVHSGIAGPYANDWLRAAFVEALVCDERLPDVVTTRHDLDLMLCGRADQLALAELEDRLHVFGALEEAIEHLETTADRIRSGQGAPTAIWFATPGQDADVVYQTIEYWAGLDLIALLRGPWPHGPSHYPQPAHRPMSRSQVFTAQPVNDSIVLLREIG
jgi:hypothetical protein